MATDINVCTFSGNVVADPKEFSYGDGKKLARIRLAVNNYGDKTAWLDLTAFDALAEKLVLPYVKKGTPITVSCTVETRDMEGLFDSEGKSINRTATSFIVQQLKLGGQGNGNGGGGDQRQASQQAAQPAEEPPPF